MATVSSQDNSALVDQTVPQWKRELILRRRALVRTLPAGNTTVKLTRPSVVAAVRQPEQGTATENVIGKQQHCGTTVLASNKGILDQERADFNPRGRISDSSSTAAAAVVGNMRLVEHIADAGAELVINGVSVDNSSINLDSSSVKTCSKMGEETSAKKMCSASRPVIDNGVLLSENNNCSHPPDDGQSDSSEELEYGPGIVNKLRSKYLSMTLRENQNKGVRPSLVNLRRATSLENMLDSEGLDAGKPQIKAQPRFVKKEDANKTTAKPQKTSQHHQRYRGISRGNDSLKRARSVEALCRNELKGNIMNRGAFRHPVKSGVIDINKNSAPVIKPLVNEDIIIVENTAKNNKKTTDIKTSPQVPKMRTASVAPETELPPPDVVKTTMKIFEGSPGHKVSFPHKTGNICPKGNAKPALPPKLNAEKVQQKCLNKSPPRRGLAPSPELRPFSPPNRLLLSPDNSSTPPLSPSSPTPGIRKLKSPSPTIESKQALFMFKEASESEQFVPQQVISNGKASSVKTSVEGESSDEDIGDGAVKTVPQTVLENIRKDGLSLEFSFNRGGKNSNEKIKSYLPSVKNSVQNEQLSPVLSPGAFNESPALKIVSSSSVSNFQQGSKQIGVIRPMVTNKNLPVSSGVTGREMEKNLINREKLNDQPKNKVLVKKKIDDIIEGVNVKEKTSNSEKNVLPSKLRSTKSGGDHTQNIMVFNFSNRKDPPPDYIPDDGLNLAPKNKFKGGDGVLILGVAGESSTDEVGGGPPSPCDVTFEGANVLINGRSNLRKQPRANKLRISFDDSATTTFEYPSESSLMDAEEEHFQSMDGKASSPSGLPLAPPSGPTPGVPVPLGGSSLASYTPSKVHLGSEDFQLGVTRANPAGAAVDPISKASDSSSVNSADLEQEEYLKPAEESETVAWSAETTADLLF
ncbi:Uncharacterized protein GBIM_13735 [Gryllus bimaculatus]|nr:Uncharacterized protein GBIM_13735 [Gryllus bimaculatus]